MDETKLCKFTGPIFLMLTFFFPVVVLILILGNPQMSKDFGPIVLLLDELRQRSMTCAKKLFDCSPVQLAEPGRRALRSATELTA